MRVNDHLATMPAGYLFAEIAKRVRDHEAAHPGSPLIRMGIGDVTLPLAGAVAKALAEAAMDMTTPEGFHGYGPEGGYRFLKELILRHDYAARGVHLEEDELFITDGAKTDTAALQELFAPDALIAVTDPVYPVYVDANAMAGRLGAYQDGRWQRLVTLPVTHENGFMPQLPRHRVDALYLCLPNNPTGTVLTRTQLQAIVDWAREKGTLLIFDAAYKAFIQDPDIPQSIYELEGAREVAIECCSFSKTAGFTGVRCAWTVVPRQLMGRMAKGGDASLNAMWKRRLGNKFNGVSYPVQRAAAAVYSPEGQGQIRQALAYYQQNAALLLKALSDTGCEPVGGVHAPYVWMKTPGGMSGWAFFDYLLREAQVVGTPGEGFGQGGAGCFRLTAFSTLEHTREAAARLRAAINKL